MNYEKLILQYAKPVSPIPTSLAPKGRPNQPVKAVIFDVYGTLFISKAGDIGGARSEAFKRINDITDLCRRHGTVESGHSILERYFDRVEREKERRCRQGIDDPEVVIEDIWEQVLGIADQDRIRSFALEFELIVNPVFPMPGSGDLLSVLRDRSIIMGIISNAQFYTPLLFSAYLGKNLDDLGFTKELLFFSYELGYGKPSSAAFEEAARRLENAGFQRDRVMYLGNDMLKDIRPARDVGFQTALFAGDSRSLNLREDEEQCRGLVPDMIVTELMQLADLLK